MIKFYLSYKNLKRLQQILVILVRHGFYPLLDRLHLTRIISASQRIRGKKALRDRQGTGPDAMRLRQALEELGPTFIKIGQMLSTRSDLLPEEYISELLKLQDRVATFQFSEAVRTIEGELGGEIHTFFTSIQEKPVAAASIAQVHGAVTKDGAEVIIKVQRPGISDIVKTDMAIVRYIANLMVRFMPESRIYDPVGTVDEFYSVLQKEMDFTLEGSYTEKFRKMFAGDERVIIPKVFWSLTNKRVITMERISGTKINQIDKLKKMGVNTEDLAHTLSDIFFRQVFKYGLFHGDLHPGNIFVVEPDRIALVDFGIVGRLDEDMMENLADVFIGIIKEDYRLLTKVYLRMGMVSEDIDEVAFKREYHDLLLHYLGIPLKNWEFGEFFVNYFRLSTKYKIRMPRNLLLLNKCIIELEGLGRSLYPDMNILKEGEPYVRRLVTRRLNPRKLIRDFQHIMSEYGDLAENLPVQLNRILKKMTSDKFTIDIVHTGLEQFTGEIDRASNRVTVGIIIASLVIGTSLISAFVRKPEIMGLPIFGIIGFSIAGCLGLWLAYHILRSGKY